MKRVEQGVPLETLDLSTCFGTSHAVRLLSEIVVDVWDLAETLKAQEQVRFTWNCATRGYFVYDSEDNFEEDDDHSDGDDEGDLHTGIDD